MNRSLLVTLLALGTFACRAGNIWLIDEPANRDAGTTGGTPLDSGTTTGPDPRDAGSTTQPPAGDGGQTTPSDLEIVLVRPTPNQTLASTIEVVAEVAGGDATRVDFTVDGATVGSATARPYQFSLDTTAYADGAHTIGAIAFDANGGSTTATPVAVEFDNAFRETFANGSTDQSGWTFGEGFAVDAAEDHTGAAGSGSLAGSAITSELETLAAEAELVVPLGAEPKLSFARKVAIDGDGFVYSGAFRVLVNDRVVDEVTTANVPAVDADWVAVEDIDLADFAEQTVTIRFELSVTNWSWTQEARALARIDDLLVTAGGSTMPPPPPPPPPPPTMGPAPYANASEQASDLVEVLDVTGRYGVAVTGGHLIASDSRGGSALPRETPIGSSGSIDIPAGATIRHAILWYAGVIFMKPHSGGQGDYTPDIGGPLDDANHVAGNGISFTIDGDDFGPFDPSSRTPPSPSALGHDSTISPRAYDPTFGTLTGVKESVWGNRLDVTGLFAGKTGTVNVDVDPPEKLDVNGNDASRNGGNPAGNTTHNLCASGASWSLLVVYEKADLPEKNLVLMDGAWARAWDYMFFHTGQWVRPKVRIDHAPIAPGAKFYIYAGSGAPSGGPIPTSPACSCGCGGQYTLRNRSSPLGRNNYFSDTHRDPAGAANDPMSRDSTNGPWYLHSTGLQPIAGNDWTLFQSGMRTTELPNLFEGEEEPSPDSRQPVTNEDDPDLSGDTYGGHPWAGRATVRYRAHGNAMSVVEIEPETTGIEPGQTTSYLYFKGDQKDVWKPQAVVSVKYVLFETPTGN